MFLDLQLIYTFLRFLLALGNKVKKKLGVPVIWRYDQNITTYRRPLLDFFYYNRSVINHQACQTNSSTYPPRPKLADKCMTTTTTTNSVKTTSNHQRKCADNCYLSITRKWPSFWWRELLKASILDCVYRRSFNHSFRESPPPSH